MAVQYCLAAKCGTAGRAFECWLLVTGFDSSMKHSNVSFLFYFRAEAIVRTENTFSKIFSDCGWLFFVIIILPYSSFFYTLEESVEVTIAERSKNRSWKFKLEHGIGTLDNLSSKTNLSSTWKPIHYCDDLHGETFFCIHLMNLQSYVNPGAVIWRMFWLVIIPSQFVLSTFESVYYNKVTIELSIFPISF